jgi:hypothetical protein
MKLVKVFPIAIVLFLLTTGAIIVKQPKESEAPKQLVRLSENQAPISKAKSTAVRMKHRNLALLR